MTRIRQQNVTAAQWSSNGEALGALDLTLPENDAFGANVFDVSEQKERLPRTSSRSCRRPSPAARRSTRAWPTPSPRR